MFFRCSSIHCLEEYIWRNGISTGKKSDFLSTKRGLLKVAYEPNLLPIPAAGNFN